MTLLGVQKIRTGGQLDVSLAFYSHEYKSISEQCCMSHIVAVADLMICPVCYVSLASRFTTKSRIIFAKQCAISHHFYIFLGCLQTCSTYGRPFPPRKKSLPSDFIQSKTWWKIYIYRVHLHQPRYHVQYKLSKFGGFKFEPGYAIRNVLQNGFCHLG